MSAQDGRKGAARILVVEDEVLISMLLEDMLGDLGYEVAATFGGMRAGTAAMEPPRRRGHRLRRWRATVSNDDLAAWSAVGAFSLYVGMALAGGGGRTLTLTFPMGCLAVALFAGWYRLRGRAGERLPRSQAGITPSGAAISAAPTSPRSRTWRSRRVNRSPTGCPWPT